LACASDVDDDADLDKVFVAGDSGRASSTLNIAFVPVLLESAGTAVHILSTHTRTHTHTHTHTPVCEREASGGVTVVAARCRVSVLSAMSLSSFAFIITSPPITHIHTHAHTTCTFAIIVFVVDTARWPHLAPLHVLFDQPRIGQHTTPIPLPVNFP
jgi:hypothetical protein